VCLSLQSELYDEIYTYIYRKTSEVKYRKYPSQLIVNSEKLTVNNGRAGEPKKKMLTLQNGFGRKKINT